MRAAAARSSSRGRPPGQRMPMLGGEIGADTGLCLSREQTAGRGRRGRSWVSDPGAGLWSSTVVRDYPQPARLPRWRVWLLSMRQADRRSRLHVKWPNDVLADDGRKLAGSRQSACRLSLSRGRIGINMDSRSWLRARRRGARLGDLDRSTLLAELLVALNNRLTPVVAVSRGLSALLPHWARVLRSISPVAAASKVERWMSTTRVTCSWMTVNHRNHRRRRRGHATIRT